MNQCHYKLYLIQSCRWVHNIAGSVLKLLVIVENFSSIFQHLGMSVDLLFLETLDACIIISYVK